ncbi:AAA family ATPase [Methylobacterium sp. CM6246]
MRSAQIKPGNASKTDALACAFLRTLKQTERGTISREVRRRPNASDGDEPAEELRRAAEGASKVESIPIRADLASVAVLVARAIGSEPGLLRRLRKDAPVVTIATHAGEVVDLVRKVVQLCVFGRERVGLEPSRDTPPYLWHKRAALMVRDGTSKQHTNEVGNDVVGAALQANVPFIGVAPDPKRDLPRDLLRAADARLALPRFDSRALALVIEAVVGSRPTRELDDARVRTIEVGDLAIALRGAATADDALDAVARVLAEKTEHVHDGPSLRDLHGYGAAREWGLALAHDIRMYRAETLKWRDLDVRILVTGPPGVGKSFFARAVAKECSLPLVATSVADWHAMDHLSGTLKRIREVFAEARSRAPCVLFIDELDGISDRSQLCGEYVPYWTQIVNLVLELLSGVEALEGVVIIGATNYPDRIDAAIRRAGRLDREIAIEPPDTTSLCAIFRQYVAGDLPPETSLMPLALAARGRTGADVEAWVRRARGAARRAGRGMVFDDVLAEILAGRRRLTPEVRRRIALHEAGHIVAHLELGLGPIVDVSIHDDGGEAVIEADLAGDATPDRVEAFISVLLAGRLAERIGLGAASIGGASDLAKATTLARDLELRYGVGLIGLIWIEPYEGDLVTMRGLLDAVSKRLQAAEVCARTLLEGNWASVEAVAASLEHSGYLTGRDILTIVEKVRVASRVLQGSDRTPPTEHHRTDDPGLCCEADPALGVSS